jgi:hypothetical protein
MALKNLLSDTVAGIYLAKDSDFNNGDQLKAGGHERGYRCRPDEI